MIRTTISAGSSAKPDRKMKPKPSTTLIALWSIAAAAEIAEFRIQHRADHDHPRHEAGGEECEEDDEEAADQRHSSH